jgi:hypothetical protein
MQLASRFASRSPVLRSRTYPCPTTKSGRGPVHLRGRPARKPLRAVQLHPHRHRAAELRGKGFEPFMVTQTRVRHDDRRDYTKHMIRLRHASQINGREANEIILLNSHDGTSSYQMLAGMFRFVCSNGLVCGDTVADVRVPHKGDVAGHVIEGAYEVLQRLRPGAGIPRCHARHHAGRRGIGSVRPRCAGVEVRRGQARAHHGIANPDAAPPRRRPPRPVERVQPHAGEPDQRRPVRPRRERTPPDHPPVQGIDQSIRLNRALWLLADGLRQLKA